MPKKRTSPRRSSRGSQLPPIPKWRQILLLLTIMPMAAGIALFVAAWADLVFLGTQVGQTVAGALSALLGFAANIQRAPGVLDVGRRVGCAWGSRPGSWWGAPAKPGRFGWVPRPAPPH